MTQTFSDLVNDAVRSWMAIRGHTHRTAAAQVGLRPGTFSARLYGQRKWSVDDLSRLAAAGVDVPLPEI